MLPALISAGAGLIGGLINRDSAEDINRRNAEMAERNIQLQREFAQNSIRWKVEDAKAAGIHPLYALGAQGASFSPVSIAGSADTSLGSAFASAGQDLSRAMNATRTNDERQEAFDKTVRDLTLQKMGLENDLLASQIAKLRAGTPPPVPAIGPTASVKVPEADKPEERPILMMGGKRWPTDSGTSNMQQFSDRYGDEGVPQWIIAPQIMWHDFFGKDAIQHNFREGIENARKWWPGQSARLNRFQRWLNP